MTPNQNNSRKQLSATEAERLIELMVAQTRDLLESSWADLQNFRKRERKMRIAIVHTLEYEGDVRTVKTQIGFGAKFKDNEETSFNVSQMELLDA
jgi:hypothetical protein